MAAAVPTTTGTIAAGRVRSRAPSTQRRNFPGAGGAAVFSVTARSALREARPPGSRTTRETSEVGWATLLEGVPPLLGLLAHVEEHGRVTGELLQPGEAVVGRVDAAFQHAERERRQREHLPAPGDRLVLELGEGDHRVDQPPLERGRRVVLAAEEPDLLRAFETHRAGEQAR